ncbi:hypothetical protein MBLNU459_g1104t1 [Dothideomycetes sp. NU459]
MDGGAGRHERKWSVSHSGQAPNGQRMRSWAETEARTGRGLRRRKEQEEEQEEDDDLVARHDMHRPPLVPGQFDEPRRPIMERRGHAPEHQETRPRPRPRDRPATPINAKRAS